MSKPKVYLSCPLQPGVRELLAKTTEVVYWPEWTPVPQDILKKECVDASGLMIQVFNTVDAALLESSTDMKVVSIVGSGTECVDIDTATRNGIPVGNTPGAASKGTADMAMALLLAGARRIAEIDRWTRAGNWEHDLSTMDLVGQEVHESTLGIVGLGQIGTEMAKRAKGFDMKVVYYSRRRKPELEQELGVEWSGDLETLLGQSDFVSLHVRLTDDTRHMIGANELGRMKETAILVNSSRGPVVDQQALCNALTNGQIMGAALDVMEVEPIPVDDPILRLENVVLSPHLGTDTEGTRLKASMTAARNLLAGLNGERLPLCVNPEVYSGD